MTFINNLPTGFRLRHVFALLAALGFAAGAGAQTPIIVTNTADSGLGSLRQAFADAAVIPGSNSITFAAALSGQTITLTNEIVVSDIASVTVDGSTLSAGVTLDGGPGTNRLFTVSTGAGLTLKNLTLTGGNGAGAANTGNGGAIFSGVHSVLTLTRCTLSGNTTPSGHGGAIYTDAYLIAATLTLEDCTLSQNSARGTFGAGGAIFTTRGTLLSMTRCTLWDNRAVGTAGAIFVSDLATLTHCTLSGNSVSNGIGGGAIFNQGTLMLAGSIIAENSLTGSGEGADIYNDGDAGATVTRLGANIVQSHYNAWNAIDSGPAAITNAPLLAPLGNYGGPTKTMALLPGSPARDAAVGSTVTSDQRGFPIVGVPDIGAYEAGTLLDYDAWVWETFPTNATPAQRLAAADYDGDGRLNATEYATLTSGSVSNAGPALVFTRNAAGTVGTNRFAIRASATDLLYQLARGTTVANLTNIVVINPTTLTTNTYGPGLTLSSSGTTLTVTDTNLTGRPQIFYQLKVVLTP